MARCYHDTQDFNSKLKIEVAREGDILEAGQDLEEIKCHKNPGHRGFIPFKDLSLEHLPNKYRNRETLDMIKKIGSVVVRLEVSVDKIINGKRMKRIKCGSGMVVKSENKYFIQTNNHIIGSEDELKHCTVEFHYDEDSKSSVFTCKGGEIAITSFYRDVTIFEFHPVPDFLHQLDMGEYEMPSIVIIHNNNQIVTREIPSSHDRLTSKYIFHSNLDLNTPVNHLMFVKWPDGYISYMKSSFFKFQPIPSNIQELTFIEIHIDEDGGNSRVIPGKVVRFANEWVVKIPESIFQDEVKKCKLVWNGEVIGRGTRLYFQNVKSKEFFGRMSGMDTVYILDHFSNGIWSFEVNFRSSDIRRPDVSSNMCCIGHPHGGIKIVTFGLWLTQSIERFDNQGRHILQPKPNCQCKEVDCMIYSCKTCVGSSGSSVFSLYADMEWPVGSSHFMGNRVEWTLPDGELIENMNIAWFAYLPNPKLADPIPSFY